MQQPILFYDGNCALCNNFVSMILKIGTKPNFYFAPLTGSTAQKLLPDIYKQTDFDAIVVWKEGKFYTHHEAVFQIIQAMPIGFKVLLFLRFLPHSVLLKLYTYVAKNRFRWKPKLEVCPMPPAKFKHQFIFD
jgi:predicted DCC family thiol-disulfide oxidoreductase YuxK